MSRKEKYEECQAFEHDLINRRLTWLLTSQTILFAALALVLGNEIKGEDKKSFFDTISYLGIFISSFIFIAICMSVLAKYRNYTDELKIDSSTKWGVRTPFYYNCAYSRCSYADRVYCSLDNYQVKIILDI